MGGTTLHVTFLKICYYGGQWDFIWCSDTSCHLLMGARVYRRRGKHCAPNCVQQVNGGMFQHDNTRPPVAHVSEKFLKCHKIQTLPWPACSLDLNPIEHLCMGCTGSVCMPEKSTTPDTSTISYGTAGWCCATFDCFHVLLLPS